MNDPGSAAFDILLNIAYWLLKSLGRYVACGPKICLESGLVVARSNLASQLLCLGFAGRRVTIATQERAVRILYRRFWVFRKSRRIEFDRIAGVAYRFSEVFRRSLAYEEDDIRSIGLEVEDGKFVTLFRYIGQGGLVRNSNLPAWMCWVKPESRMPASGPDELESLAYAETLSYLIGVPLDDQASALPDGSSRIR